MFSRLQLKNYEINNNLNINTSYTSSKYNINKLHKWQIIKNIKKQISNDISINNYCDLKNKLFWNNNYLVIPDKYLNQIHWTRCRNFDIYNIYIYQKNCKLYNNIMRKINNSNLKLEKKPEPLPRLSNLHRQYLYFKRNENKNNLLQTKAIIYLIKNKYILVDDINDIKNKNNKTIYFESYQALELANELCHIQGIKLNDILFYNLNSFISSLNITNNIPLQPTAPFDNLNNTNNVFDINNNNLKNTNDINNINNIKNVNDINNIKNTNDINNINDIKNVNDINDINNGNDINDINNINNINDINEPIILNNKNLNTVNMYSTNNLENNNQQLNNEWLDNEKNYYKSKLSRYDDVMICSHPEHHNIKDKIKYYSKNNK